MNYYNLVIECKAYEAARECATYFEKNQPILSNHRTIATETQLHRRGDGCWLVGVSFEGLFLLENMGLEDEFGNQKELNPSLSQQKTSIVTDSEKLQEAVSEIFSLLSVAPPYSAAAFGVDAIDAFSQMAIEEIILQNSSFGYLFLADTVWERLGEPQGFEPFSDGYYWNPN